jgi:hypothetical protein
MTITEIQYENIADGNWLEVQPSGGNVYEGGVITAFPGGIPTQADQDLWTAEYEAYLPTKAWEQAMAGTDAIPRWAEDIISQRLDAVAAKKALLLLRVRWMLWRTFLRRLISIAGRHQCQGTNERW